MTFSSIRIKVKEYRPQIQGKKWFFFRKTEDASDDCSRSQTVEEPHYRNSPLSPLETKSCFLWLWYPFNILIKENIISLGLFMSTFQVAVFQLNYIDSPVRSVYQAIEALINKISLYKTLSPFFNFIINQTTSSSGTSKWRTEKRGLWDTRQHTWWILEYFVRHDTNLIFVFATPFPVSNMAAEWIGHAPGCQASFPRWHKIRDKITGRGQRSWIVLVWIYTDIGSSSKCFSTVLSQ